MGRHEAPGSTANLRDPVAEVTLDRVAAAFEGLGFDPLVRTDRLIIGLPSFTAAAWIDRDRPLTLVVDLTERIPIAFDHGRALATFINMWNHDQIGPVASYRLADSGDFSVRLRRGTLVDHGLSDTQLIADLFDSLEHATAFFSHLRERFLPARFDVPLPPTLSRSLDHAALVGRHPAHRHLPYGERRQVHGEPDTYAGPEPGDVPLRPVPLRRSGLECVLTALKFSYSRDGGVLTTGVNGVPFALTLDGGNYARVTAMWDAQLDADESFLTTWLACNDLNEQSSSLSVYLHEYEGNLHVHAEATCLVTEGLTEGQRDGFIVSSLLSCLSAIDRISIEVTGSSVVEWPPADSEE